MKSLDDFQLQELWLIMFYDFLLSYSNWKFQIVIALIFTWKNTQITHSPGFFLTKNYRQLVREVSWSMNVFLEWDRFIYYVVVMFFVVVTKQVISGVDLKFLIDWIEIFSLIISVHIEGLLGVYILFCKSRVI